MEYVNLIQGSPEWHAHRAQHWNASDAPAMLGISPNRTRDSLVRELATGQRQEFSDWAQANILNKGHAVEAIARSSAEALIGDDLAPVTGKRGKYSASFDGLTFDGLTGWESKLLNQALAAAFGTMGSDCDDLGILLRGDLLPESYRAQMEQQLLVSGADRVLFTASDDSGQHHCWYTHDAGMLARLQAGWRLLEKDVAEYTPPAAEAHAIARQALPALSFQARGEVTASNLEAFAQAASREIAAVNLELVTDQDFANADSDAKWCSAGEEAVDQAKRLILGQTGSIHEALAALDSIGAQFRDKRLVLTKCLKTEKDARKAALVADTQEELNAHAQALNAQLRADCSGVSPVPKFTALGAPIFNEAIKGLKTLASMQNALSAALVRCIAQMDAQATQMARNRQALLDCSHLFPDFDRVGAKPSEDFDALLALRQRNAADEQAKREQAKELVRAQAAAAPAPPAARAPASNGSVLKLGELNVLLGVCSVNAASLEHMGFSVSKQGAASVVPAGDLPAICDALIAKLTRVRDGMRKAA